MSPTGARPLLSDPIDTLALVLFVAASAGLPALGYVFMVVDYRRYLRSLRRALVTVAALRWELPGWVRRETPRCLGMFGLALPCSEAQLLTAYRRRVKRLHPDRGGDRRKFLAFQAQFEEALRVVRQHRDD